MRKTTMVTKKTTVEETTLTTEVPSKKELAVKFNRLIGADDPGMQPSQLVLNGPEAKLQKRKSYPSGEERFVVLGCVISFLYNEPLTVCYLNNLLLSTSISAHSICAPSDEFVRRIGRQNSFRNLCSKLSTPEVLIKEFTSLYGSMYSDQG